MKKALYQGILAVIRGPRAVRNRYCAKVPGLADEGSTSRVDTKWGEVEDASSWCYLGLQVIKGQCLALRSGGEFVDRANALCRS